MSPEECEVAMISYLGSRVQGLASILEKGVRLNRGKNTKILLRGDPKGSIKHNYYSLER
jgi:hypothetical protein